MAASIRRLAPMLVSRKQGQMGRQEGKAHSALLCLLSLILVLADCGDMALRAATGRMAPLAAVRVGMSHQVVARLAALVPTKVAGSAGTAALLDACRRRSFAVSLPKTR